MYTTELQKTAKIENLEDPKLLEAFEARVAVRTAEGRAIAEFTGYSRTIGGATVDI